jgi:hypothetical protein
MGLTDVVWGWGVMTQEQLDATRNAVTCPGAQPLGTESLPRDILAMQSDLYPRRLWGKPEGVLFLYDIYCTTHSSSLLPMEVPTGSSVHLRVCHKSRKPFTQGGSCLFCGPGLDLTTSHKMGHCLLLTLTVCDAGFARQAQVFTHTHCWPEAEELCQPVCTKGILFPPGLLCSYGICL